MLKEQKEEIIALLFDRVIEKNHWWAVCDKFVLFGHYKDYPLIPAELINAINEIIPIKHFLTKEGLFILDFDNQGIHRDYWQFIHNSALRSDLNLTTTYSTYSYEKQVVND